MNLPQYPGTLADLDRQRLMNHYRVYAVALAGVRREDIWKPQTVVDYGGHFLNSLVREFLSATMAVLTLF